MADLLVAIQFWDGDAARAGQLAELLAATHGGHADLLFFARSDAQRPARARTLRPGTHVARSARAGSGWPAGPNQLWFGLVEYLRAAFRSGEIPRYQAVFTTEPDMVPIHRDWAARLLSDWNPAGADVMGAYMDGPDLAVAPHVNGNLLLRGTDEVLSAVASQAPSCPPDKPWDVWIHPFLSQHLHVAHTGLMFNAWRSATIAPTSVCHWARQGFALIHGVRDDSCLRAAREILR